MKYMICKYLLPFSRLSFVDGFLCGAEGVNLELGEKSRRENRTTDVCNTAVIEGDKLESNPRPWGRSSVMGLRQSMWNGVLAKLV